MAKLAAKELKILQALEFDAEKSIEVIRKESGLSEHSIRYHQHRFISDGVITRTPIIDLPSRGYNFIGIFFNPSLKEQNLRSIIQRSIIPLNEIVWLAEFVGEYRYGMAVAGRDLATIDQIITGLSDKFPRLFRTKSIAHQLNSTFFTRKYLGGSQRNVKQLKIGTTSDSKDLDTVDKKILGIVASDGSISRRKLAQKLGIPLTTIDYRFERLRKDGVLRGFTYSIDTNFLGRQNFMLLVFGNGMSSEFSKAVYNFAHTHPDVTSLYRCLGWWDFELDIEAENHSKVLEIADQLLSVGREWINSIKILSGVKTLKHTMVPFTF